MEPHLVQELMEKREEEEKKQAKLRKTEIHETSSDIISTKNGTKYEVNCSSITDEEDSDSDDENDPTPEPAQGSSKGGFDTPSSSLPIPYSVECDNCGDGNRTTYYHCRSCPDFDLCSDCVSQGCTNNPRHELVPVRQVSRSLSPRPENVPGGRREKSKIDCDRCNERDMVIYYRCRTCRPRFDLCETCYVDEHKRCKVDPRHGFVKTQYVGDRRG